MFDEFSLTVMSVLWIWDVLRKTKVMMRQKLTEFVRSTSNSESLAWPSEKI